MPLWKLLGKSHAIVQGIISVPKAEIQKAVESGEHHFISVPIKVSRALKGADVPAEITLRYFSDSEQYGGVSRETLIGFDGQEGLMFLLASPKGYYLAAYSTNTLQAATDGLLEQVRTELALQAGQVSDFDSETRSRILPLDAEVRDLIDRLTLRETDPATAAAIHETMVEMGKEAVPALIKYMDDRRKLRIPKISYAVKDPDWEGIIHYGPEVVTDVVSVILTRITGENLTQIYNGGSEIDRANAVKLWKVYVRRQSGKM